MGKVLLRRVWVQPGGALGLEGIHAGTPQGGRSPQRCLAGWTGVRAEAPESRVDDRELLAVHEEGSAHLRSGKLEQVTLTGALRIRKAAHL
jgi:hypothetical protein